MQKITIIKRPLTVELSNYVLLSPEALPLDDKNKEKLQELFESYNPDRNYDYISNDYFMYTCESKYSDVLKEVIDISIYEMWLRDMDNDEVRLKFIQELNKVQNLMKEMGSVQNSRKNIFSAQEIKLYFYKRKRIKN